MIRDYLFSEKLGRNIIWVMLSGFFLKIGAKENSFGQIVMPKDHFLFNLDEKNIDNNYLKYKHLHYIFLDGPAHYLEDERFKKIKKEVNIYYVGKLNCFWKTIKNSQQLFSDDLNENLNTIELVKKKFPIFFKKYFLKKSFTTLGNLKKMDLSFKHILGKKRYVYYGYIKPIEKHLNKFQKILNLDYDDFKILFELKNNINNLQYKIRYICNLKDNLIKKSNIQNLPYINEFLLFMIRYVICSFLQDKENFFIYDGLGGDNNFNAYEMFFGKHHTYLDFGSKVGFDKIYPRLALLQFSNRESIRFDLDEDFLFQNMETSSIYLQKKIDEFFNKLNIKS